MNRIHSWKLFNRVLCDSTPRFVAPSVCPSVRTSVRPHVRISVTFYIFFFVFAVFGLTASAQMIKWPQKQVLPTRMRLRWPSIWPCFHISASFGCYFTTQRSFFAHINLTKLPGEHSTLPSEPDKVERMKKKMDWRRNYEEKNIFFIFWLFFRLFPSLSGHIFWTAGPI